jgi:hypothetical protein
VTYQIGRTIAGGIGFGVLPLLAGWKFHVADVSLTGPAAYAAAAAIGGCGTVHPLFDPARCTRVIQNGPAPKLSGWTTS